MPDKIDTLKERTTGDIVYPETILDAVKVSGDSKDVSLKEILKNNNLITDYELYSFKVNLADSNPQTRISYFDMAYGKQPAFWDYTNGYFNYGDWANAFFIKNTFPCMVKYDGSIDYVLDENNYNLKSTGETSDISNTDYEGSAMVAFPVIWIKRWTDKNYLYCSICNKQIDEEYHAYMHTNKNGVIKNHKFIGMYFSTLFTDRYKSLSDQIYTRNQTYSNECLYTHTNGENWECFSWSDFATISDLLTLISKSDNSQKCFGFGRNDATEVKTNSDPGKVRYGGAFYNSAAVNTNSYQKIFGIYNLFDEQYTRISGLIYLNGSIFVKPYPPYNDTAEGYENLGITFSGTSDGYIKTTTVNQYGRFPTEIGGSATTYECDSLMYSNTITAIAKSRGVYNAGEKAGKMALVLNATSAANSNTVNRLTCYSME